jgi:hypothetical protein
MLHQLELFGRYTLNPMTSGVDGSAIWSCIIPHYDEFQADPAAFISELNAVIASDNCNFATFGAARLVWEMYSSRINDIPSAIPHIDAGIEFKVARGMIQMSDMTGYEVDRIVERRRQGENI